MSAVNKLYYGDCLTIMRDKLLLDSVDLIYLDPPFNSNRDYNAIYKDETERPLPDQVEAFCDTWTLDEATERSIKQMPVLMREAGVEDSVAEFWRLWMNALRNTQPRLLAYIAYMAERLLAMRPLLRPTGSIYLHCDPTASHYIKVLMDAVFGHGNFQNEVVWKRTSSHNSAKRWGPIHDSLLFYTKSSKFTWNRVFQAYDQAYIDRSYRLEDNQGRYRLTEITGPGAREGQSGESWRGINPTDRGRHWAVPRLPEWASVPKGYASMSVQERLDEIDSIGLIDWPRRGEMPRFKRHLDTSAGVPIQDMVTDIPPVGGSEDMGYDTQKPIRLLERIIQASSNPGDVVLDPFCGCASTIEAAHRLERNWVGIDIAIHAIKRVATKRLDESLRLVEGVDYEIEGVPQTFEGAKDLWERDKYHFQKWAVEQVDGFVTARRSGDGGVDGRIYFPLPSKPDLQSMVVEVKGGKNVGINVMRELRGVLDNDDSARLAGLIVMEPLGTRKERNFKNFMAKAGHLEVSGTLYPRLQMLTVEQILDGRRFQTPGVAARGIGQQSLEVSS